MRESSKLRFTGGVRLSTVWCKAYPSSCPRGGGPLLPANPVQSKRTNYNGVDDGMGVYALNSSASLGFDRGKTYRLRVTD
jgi:hypothetical protein